MSIFFPGLDTINITYNEINFVHINNELQQKITQKERAFYKFVCLLNILPVQCAWQLDHASYS